MERSYTHVVKENKNKNIILKYNGLIRQPKAIVVTKQKKLKGLF